MNYNDLSDDLQRSVLSGALIEQQISEYKLTFISVKDKMVEWGMKFPMFVPAFYDFVFQRKLIPDQNSYWEHYLAINSSDSVIRGLTDELKLGLKARVFRTYPSLVRDIHFVTTVKESASFDNVIYNMKLDIEKGVDMLIEQGNKLFAVNLYTKTYRAQIGREKKKYRHTSDERFIYVEFPVEFKGSKQCGDFFLYGSKELGQLKSLILGS